MLQTEKILEFSTNTHTQFVQLTIKSFSHSERAQNILADH